MHHGVHVRLGGEPFIREVFDKFSETRPHLPAEHQIGVPPLLEERGLMG